MKGRRGIGISGEVFIDAGAQTVIERTAVQIDGEFIEARLQVGLPAKGRTILGQQAKEMLLKELPHLVTYGLKPDHIDLDELQKFVEVIENQEFIRQKLTEKNLMAFVANGSILPRQSGVNDRPLMSGDTVVFKSPPEYKVSFQLPNPSHLNGFDSHEIEGMGIPKGITLIVGGGFHGKSTLLKALSHGVYPHIPGDGREYVVSDSATVKIKAEDGRSIQKVNISPFLNNLPGNHSTENFSTQNASGSTSQAANIIEALEVGGQTLLIDEDTSATNFMIRDFRMQQLVNKKSEPITPFIDQITSLWNDLNVSTVLVLGGSGDYFDTAHHVIMMDHYLPQDKTSEAKSIVKMNPTSRRQENKIPLGKPSSRKIKTSSLNAKKGKYSYKIDVGKSQVIRYGAEEIDLSGLEQIADTSQLRAIGHAIYTIYHQGWSESNSLNQILIKLENFINEKGVDALDPQYRQFKHPGNLSRPRTLDVAAALNRLRKLEVLKENK